MKATHQKHKTYDATALNEVIQKVGHPDMSLQQEQQSTESSSFFSDIMSIFSKKPTQTPTPQRHSRQTSISITEELSRSPLSHNKYKENQSGYEDLHSASTMSKATEEDELSNTANVHKIKSLSYELNCLKLRESKYQKRIADLEKEKGLLINAIEEGQRKIVHRDQLLKDEKKKMVTIIDAVRTSYDNSTTMSTDNVPQIIAEQDPQEILRYNKDLSNYVGSLLKKIKNLEVQVNDLTNKNRTLNDGNSKAEGSINTLESFLSHHKLQLQRQEQLRMELIQKNQILNKENLQLKRFVKDLSINGTTVLSSANASKSISYPTGPNQTIDEEDEATVMESVKGNRSSVGNQYQQQQSQSLVNSGQKNTKKEQKNAKVEVPSYLKALSFSLVGGGERFQNKTSMHIN